MIFGITATSNFDYGSGSYRGYTFPSVDEDNFELVPEEELGHLNLL